MLKRQRTLVSLTLVLGGLLPNSATALTVGAFDSGWVCESCAGGALHPPENTNYLAGLNSGSNYNNFFAWDLSSYSGTVTAASVLMFVAAYSSPDPSETFALHAVDETAATALLTATAHITGPAALSLYDDLVIGSVLGQVSVPSTAANQFVELTLNTAGVAAVNAAIGGVLFVGGGLATVIPGPSQLLFGDSNLFEGNTQVAPTVDPPLGPGTAFVALSAEGLVPEPRPAHLSALGLTLVALRRWGRRRIPRTRTAGDCNRLESARGHLGSATRTTAN